MRQTFKTTTALIASLSLIVPGPVLSQEAANMVCADGSAQPLAVSAWNSKSHLIPPGSTIIVPRDPKPLTFMDGAKDLTAILANLATTAIFAEDLTDGR